MRGIILGACCLLFLTVLTHAQTINIATYNIRYDASSDRVAGNGWDKRSAKVCGLTEFHGFDIFGAQEVLHHQLDDMLSGLPGYGYVGVGRDDGEKEGEYVPVFYRKDKFELIDSGNFWLSPDPSKPSLGWDAACVRMCTWGRFRLREGGKEFWLFNTHFDHIGKVARRESARLILSSIRELTPAGAEVILTGDFNVNETDEVFSFITDSPFMEDSYSAAALKYAWSGTFNAFDTGKAATDRIDYIFVSPGMNVRRYGVLTDSYRDIGGGEVIRNNDPADEAGFMEPVLRYPSDHFPVMITVEF